MARNQVFQFGGYHYIPLLLGGFNNQILPIELINPFKINKSDTVKRHERKRVRM